MKLPMYDLSQSQLGQLLIRIAKFLAENERLLVVAASTMIMSLSHTALRPVLPVFAKVSPSLFLFLFLLSG
jgi:hypothetical protein